MPPCCQKVTEQVLPESLKEPGQAIPARQRTIGRLMSVPVTSALLPKSSTIPSHATLSLRWQYGTRPKPIFHATVLHAACQSFLSCSNKIWTDEPIPMRGKRGKLLVMRPPAVANLAPARYVLTGLYRWRLRGPYSLNRNRRGSIPRISPEA